MKNVRVHQLLLKRIEIARNQALQKHQLPEKYEFLKQSNVFDLVRFLIAKGLSNFIEELDLNI